MSKLNVGQNAGYTKSKNDSVPENYPNTIVEAVYWDDKKKLLSEALSDIEKTFDDKLDTKLEAPDTQGQVGQVLQLAQNGKSAWVDAATGGTYDGALSDSSTNAPQNKVVTAKLSELGHKVDDLNNAVGLESVDFSGDWNDGSYRQSSNGAIATNAGYSYTNPIEVKKGDVVFSDTAIVNTIAVITKVSSAGVVQSVLQAGVSPNTTIYYRMTEDCYISLSFLKTAKDHIFIYKMNLAARVEEVADAEDFEFERLNAILNNSELSGEIVTDYTPDKIWDNSSQIITQATYCYSAPIAVNAGDKVVFSAVRGLSWETAVMKVDASNTAISRVKVYPSTGEQSFVVDITFDGYISVSCRTDTLKNIYISKKDSIGELKGFDEEISTDLLYAVIRFSADNTTSGYYRWHTNGAPTALAGYSYSNPIEVKKGDILVGTTWVSNTCALLTKVTSTGTAIKVLKAGEGSAGTTSYRVMIEEDCYVSVSTTTQALYDNFYIYRFGYVQEQMERAVQIDPLTKFSAMRTNPLAYIVKEMGFGAILHEWGFIGDSLSSGEMDCYESGVQTYVDMYEYSVGQYFAKLNGCEAYNFSHGGETARGWCTAQIVSGGTWVDVANSLKPRTWIGAETNLKQGYVVALGVNDRGAINNNYYSGGLGSASDIDLADYTNNADSFFGWYAGVIQRVLSVQPTAKIFCVTFPGNTNPGDNYYDINNAIRSICAMFSDCYLVDLGAYFPVDDNNNGYYLNSHGSPAGYLRHAFALNTYIDWIIRQNFSAFKDAALIGTQYTPTA